MNINLKNIKVDYNHGVGILPVSIFVELGGEETDIQQVYQSIRKWDHLDIIFHGEIDLNLEPLKWLTAKLLSDSMYVSILYRLNKNLPDIAISSFIVCVNITARNVRLLTPVLKSLQQRDVLVLLPESAKTLSFARHQLFKNEIDVRKVMFLARPGLQEEVLQAGIYDITPIERLIQE